VGLDTFVPCVLYIWLPLQHFTLCIVPSSAQQQRQRAQPPSQKPCYRHLCNKNAVCLEWHAIYFIFDRDLKIKWFHGLIEDTRHFHIHYMKPFVWFVPLCEGLFRFCPSHPSILPSVWCRPQHNSKDGGSCDRTHISDTSVTIIMDIYSGFLYLHIMRFILLTFIACVSPSVSVLCENFPERSPLRSCQSSLKYGEGDILFILQVKLLTFWHFNANLEIRTEHVSVL